MASVFQGAVMSIALHHYAEYSSKLAALTGNGPSIWDRCGLRVQVVPQDRGA